MFSNVKEKSYYLYWLAIFIALFCFFSYIHPLVIYDGDDWANISVMRTALPKWGAWNPIKVFPEEFYPIAGYIAAYVVMPIIGDYINAVTFTAAFILSSFITIYIFVFYKFVKKVFDLPRYQSSIVSFIFLLLHFLIFKVHGTASMYLFQTVNLTCVFHYLLPAILNMCVVLYFMQSEIKGDLLLTKDPVKNGVLLFVLYMTICSNILGSIIFAAYLAVKLLIDRSGSSTVGWKRYILDNKFIIILLIAWLLSLFFEAHGGRSKQIGVSILQLPFAQTWAVAKSILPNINRTFLVIAVLLIVSASSIYYRTKQKLNIDSLFNRHIKLSFMAMIFTFIYLFLVSSKASPGYIGRTDVIIGVAFYLLLVISLSLIYVLKKYPHLWLIMPIFTFVITMATLESDTFYYESTVNDENPAVCAAIDRNLIKQITDAEQNGQTEMTLYVPKGDDHDNWPHPLYMGNNIRNTLFRHGIIHTPNLKITIAVDEDMNRQYHLNVK